MEELSRTYLKARAGAIILRAVAIKRSTIIWRAIFHIFMFYMMKWIDNGHVGSVEYGLPRIS